MAISDGANTIHATDNRREEERRQLGIPAVHQEHQANDADDPAVQLRRVILQQFATFCPTSICSAANAATGNSISVTEHKGREKP